MSPEEEVPLSPEENTTRLEENKAVVRRFFDEAWNTPSEGPPTASAILAPGFRYSEDPIVGPTRVSGMGQSLWVEIRKNREAFPGLHAEVEKLVADDQEVAAWWSFSATHDGTVRLGGALTNFAEIEPTGREIQASAVTLFRIEEGQIASVRTVWQPLSPLQQLAVLEGKMDMSKLLQEDPD